MSSALHSVCTLDCPDTCSLSVWVEDGRMTKVRGSTANPLTGGKICAKVTRYPELVHGRGRIPAPLRRVGQKGVGRFEQISWDAALDEIHARFMAIIAEHGPQAISPLNYAGPHGMLAGGSMDMRFFHKLGASLLHRRSLCGGIKSEAHCGTFGNVPTMRPEHVGQARLIVPWGNNVSVSNLHLVPIIYAAQAKGAKLVVIDPMRTPIAGKADMHIALRPGTDLVLAWSIATELERLGALDQEFIARHVQGAEPFMARARQYPAAQAAEICGIPEAQIHEFVRLYAASSP
ncbi:MAG: molybdopterin-dependent oxidoreductase, partial [Candidatus Lambdaproteobacteria bacterium]|nr:molybdopterin-dependent oxidoreductase [Candidatus Lambdaproteobacteria bacterium]